MNRTIPLALAALLLIGTSLPAMAEDTAAPSGDGTAKERPNKANKERGDRGAKMFQAADANGDGELTKDEMLQNHQKRIDKMFEELDADKSGKLSKGELDAGRDKMREKMKERWKDKKGKGGGDGSSHGGPPPEGEDDGPPPPPPEE